jgi:hypothetical protein
VGRQIEQTDNDNHESSRGDVPGPQKSTRRLKGVSVAGEGGDHYGDVRLLEPASVDPSTGYRRYATSQVPIAHAIRRLRDLDIEMLRGRQ